MTKTDLYAIVYLLNEEMRKTAKNMNPGVPFNSGMWPIAIDRINREAAFTGMKTHEIKADRMVKAANAITSGQTNLETFKVFLFGEYIRQHHGQFLKRKKDGSLYAPRGKGKKKNPVYNALDADAIGKLEGIRFYKPEALNDQVHALKDYSDKVVSVKQIDDEQKNELYKLVCDGVIGMHLYVHLWNLNDGFGIDITRVQDEEYGKFLKMAQYLAQDFDLKKIFYHEAAS